MPGRIGDTPIVGGGTYADNLVGALSATGTGKNKYFLLLSILIIQQLSQLGEVIMKAVLVFDILKRVEYKGIDIQTAAQDACDEMKVRYEDDGGVIGLDKDGNVAIGFSSDQMSWAYQKDEENVYYGINPGDNFEYNIEKCKNRNCFTAK